MATRHRKTNNYSLTIYQSKVDRKRVYLRLLFNGKMIDAKEYTLYGGFEKVGKTVLRLVRYARKNEVSFKEAWDSDEVWD